jgi:hypothetical protein
MGISKTIKHGIAPIVIMLVAGPIGARTIALYKHMIVVTKLKALMRPKSEPL